MRPAAASASSTELFANKIVSRIEWLPFKKKFFRFFFFYIFDRHSLILVALLSIKSRSLCAWSVMLRTYLKYSMGEVDVLREGDVLRQGPGRQIQRLVPIVSKRNGISLFST